MNTTLLKQSAESVAKALDTPQACCALVLGSGWGAALAGLSVKRSLKYAEIPAMGAVGVEGHAGVLHLAECAGRALLVFQGRRHWYEGEGWAPVAFPIYLCRQLAVPAVLLTNAAGGLRPDLKVGDLMVIDDHINAMGANPLLGRHDPVWGPRFPDQTEVYDRKLRNALDEAAAAIGQRLPHGVYLAAAGPTYETPAEIGAFRAWGADAVGMSTVPEAMLAHAAGLRVAALSCITNAAAGLSGKALSHAEVLEATERAKPRMKALLLEFLSNLPRHEQR